VLVPEGAAGGRRGLRGAQWGGVAMGVAWVLALRALHGRRVVATNQCCGARLMPSGRGQPPLVDPAAASKRGLRAATARSKALQEQGLGESAGNL